jgi:hypothetical protein
MRVGRHKKNNSTKDPENRCSTVSRHNLPNILLYHCPWVMVDHNYSNSWYSSHQSPVMDRNRNFPTLKVSQRPHLHLIIAVVSCMYLLSIHHLAFEDMLLGKTFPSLNYWKCPHISQKSSRSCTYSLHNHYILSIKAPKTGNSVFSAAGSSWLPSSYLKGTLLLWST